jgi:hypothetical protein
MCSVNVPRGLIAVQSDTPCSGELDNVMEAPLLVVVVDVPPEVLLVFVEDRSLGIWGGADDTRVLLWALAAKPAALISAASVDVSRLCPSGELCLLAAEARLLGEPV